MPYSRQEFLALFEDADPYEDIHGDWDFYIRQCPAKITYAIEQANIFDLTGQGEWANDSRFALKNWMTAIEQILRLICQENTNQGSGMFLLDVTYYNALFDRVTAERIMQAWINTTKTKRLMTILTIDELRREVWNEEIVSFKIAPALGDR